LLNKELEHLTTAPYDIWQVVRISSANLANDLNEEVRFLKDELSYQLRNHSYSVAVKREGRKIYLMKKRTKK